MSAPDIFLAVPFVALFAYASPFWNDFWVLLFFIISVGKRLVTSTNLEYSFFFS